MSLTVYLTSDLMESTHTCSECGNTYSTTDPVEYFSANINHNLNKMAEAAGIYDCLWRPDEIGITKAHQLIHPLTLGLALMKSDPEKFEKYNARNGWGLYEHFVPWIERYLEACIKYPDANVSVDR